MACAAPTAEAARQLALFRRSLPLRLKLQELLRALGPAGNLACLEAGATGGALSYHLRRAGGQWSTVAADAASAEAVRQIVGDAVAVYEGQPFPFEKKSFDAVVIVDGLERIPDDARFIEECHKVLKPDGRLVVSVSRIKSGSAIRPLRRLFGGAPEREGWVRDGYTESDLFNALKDGFDVISTRTYCRFCVEFVELVVGAWARRLGAAPERLERLYRNAGPFYWLANQVDLLLLLSRGFRMIAVAKRRAWRPRKTPVLVDGRSITEAVLSRPTN
jgi:SAM-dependent methyltransferase